MSEYIDDRLGFITRHNNYSLPLVHSHGGTVTYGWLLYAEELEQGPQGLTTWSP